jgi:hypothetical protein
MLQDIERPTTINKIGVMVSDLRSSTLNHQLISFGNRLVNERADFDFYVFNEDWKQPPTSLCFPLLQQKHAWGFTGCLIATNFATAKKLLSLPDTCKKFFYVWNAVEWMNVSNSASEVLDVYHNPKLHMLARSEDHAFLLTNNFNKPVEILRDFEYEPSIKLFKT